MNRPIKLEKLQERARLMTLAELENYIMPEEIRATLTLGVQFDEDFRIFELYVPGEKPSDARVISQARLNVYSGEGSVEVLGLEKKTRKRRKVIKGGCGTLLAIFLTDIFSKLSSSVP